MKIHPLKRPAAENVGMPKKKRRLKYISVLPSFITLMNGACGFIAIIFASRSSVVNWNLFFMRRASVTFFALSGFMIFLAMVADMLDGRVARLTRTTSSFGGQLDSLSDAISFGIAPAFLMLKLVEFHLENLQFGRFSLIIGRCIIFCAVLYAMCAVVRLARFNVENEEDESAHMNFSGLPSPAAAGVVVSLAIFHQQLLSRFVNGSPDLAHTFELVTVFAFPLITLLAGILMVTRIRYPHVANQLLRRKKSLPSLLLIFACGFFIIWYIELAMVVGFCGFAVFGIVRWIIWSFTKKNPPRPAPPAEAGQGTV